MKCSSKINISWDAKELDEFLGHSFMAYSFVLAYWTIEHFLPHSDYPEAIKKNIKREQNQLIEGIRSLKGFGKDREDLFNRCFELHIKKIHLLKEQFNLFQKTTLQSKGKTKGRPRSLKYEIASIWAFKMRWEKKIPWTNVVLLLEWFYEKLKDTPYGEFYKTSDIIKEKSRSFKKQCSPIIDQHFDTLYIIKKLVFVEYNELGLQSIKFTKKSIEINRVGEPGGKIGTIKMMFKEGKQYLTHKDEDIPREKCTPFVRFPNGQTFFQGSE